ncbi:MAG: rhomboid family intramembrane serine protease [Candidatus Binatia bacterium]
MIPLSDASRRPLRVPAVTALIIAVNVAVFLLELANGDPFVLRWSLVPASVVAGRNWITILTAMFLHAGWLHIVGNMVFLWAFGPEIEDVMGRVRYPIFYLLGGSVAFLAQTIVNPTSTVPTLGASGAIAAVMGAFLVTYPRDRIRTVVFLFLFATVTFIPAAILVGVWFLIQVFSEIGVLASGQTNGVAFMVHVSGFLFGALSARFFEIRERRVAQGLER